MFFDEKSSILSKILGNPCQTFFLASDTLTAGQVAPQSQLEESANDRGEVGVGGGSLNQVTSTSRTFEDPSFGGVFS